MYLGVIKRIGIAEAKRIFIEITDSRAQNPAKLFLWKTSQSNLKNDMLLNILTEPNTILRQKAKDINWGTIDKTVLASLATDMLETMYVKDGVGLAAPQVGHSIRMFVISKAYSLDKTQEMVLINPVWEKASIFKVWDEEGCLSVPDIYGHVKRFKK